MSPNGPPYPPDGTQPEWLFPPVVPPTEGSGRVYLADVETAGQQKVFVYGPTAGQQRVYAIPLTGGARDQGQIVVQTILQTYFQDSHRALLPREHWVWDGKPEEDGGGDGALASVMQVFSLTLDEVKQAIDEFVLLLDVEHCPPRYLKTIADVLNYPLEDSDSTYEQRRQLRTAISWYKARGSRKAFESILYAFGYYADVIPLWTRKVVENDEVVENYSVFAETIPGVAPGTSPPNDHPLLLENGGEWYRSPHFGIRLRAIVGDRHLSIDWTGVSPALKLEYESLAAEIGTHQAFYEMADELYAAGASLLHYFSADDWEYIRRRLEFARPVFAVLDWLELAVDMVDYYEIQSETVENIVHASLRDKGWYLGYCDMNDAVYTRLDPRLLGPDYLTLSSPLSAGAPTVVTVDDEVAFSVVATLTIANGVLANHWLYPGVAFTAIVGGSPVAISDEQQRPVSDEVVDDSPDGAETSFLGILQHTPVIPGSFTRINVDTGSGPGDVDLTDDGLGNISGPGGISGTLDYDAGAWTLDFPSALADESLILADYEFLATEGTLHGDGVIGTIDYLSGAWEIVFDAPGPDVGTDILADYLYTTEVPPVDRSGTMPRGSTELPFPHVRDPQEGICHPMEDLYVDWTGVLDEDYSLPLTRDGMGLYPPSGPWGDVDYFDFPSRGYLSSGGPAHAHTFTRETGTSPRPLALLRVRLTSGAGAGYHGEDAARHGEDAAPHGGES